MWTKKQALNVQTIMESHNYSYELKNAITRFSTLDPLDALRETQILLEIQKDRAVKRLVDSKINLRG